MLYVLLCLIVRTVAWQTIWASVDANLLDRGRGFGHAVQWDSEHSDRPPRPPEMPGPSAGFEPRLVWAGPGIDPPREVRAAYRQDSVARALKGERQFQSVELEGQACRLLTLPVRDKAKKVVAVIQLPVSVEDFNRSLQGLDRTLLILLPAGLASMAIASLFLVNRAIWPVRRIGEDTARIGAENLSERIEVTGEDEFAELGRTINGMLDRVEEAFLLQRQSLGQLEKGIRQQRRFAADASHELKTPLSVAKIHAGFLARSEDPDVRHSAEEIDGAVSRMTNLVNDLLLLARTDSGQLQPRMEECDLGGIAERAARYVVGNEKIVLDLPEAPVAVLGSQDALERLLINLLANACRHTATDGRVQLSLRAEGGEATVAIEDDGEGIEAEHLPHLFERFYRGDAGRTSGTGGTGLGLAICKEIVDAHGGGIFVESEVGRGSRFVVRIPTLANTGVKQAS